MYAPRIILISLLLLLSHPGRAQVQSAADSAGIYSRDTVVHQATEEFDIKGKKVINDSTVAFGADKVIPGKDNIPVVKKHSPIKAVWMSAVLPGLGQAYNKKYWKIPIIYAGLAGLGYWIYFENKEFRIARTAYRAAVRNEPDLTADYKGVQLGYSTIKSYRDYYKNLLNYAAIVTALWYTLNLVDAAVDGHLYHFNVDDKLSMHVDPTFMLPTQMGMSQGSFGLSLSFSPMAAKKRYEPSPRWQ